MQVKRSEKIKIHPLKINSFKCVNACIYCGSDATKLTDEHILPLSIGGIVVLPKSSCMSCQSKINKEVEGPLFGGLLKPARIKGDYPSRPKSKKREPSAAPPTNWEVTLNLLNGQKRRQYIPNSDILNLYLEQDYGQPPFIAGTLDGVTQPVKLTVDTLHQKIRAHHIRQTIKKTGASQAKASSTGVKVGRFEMFFAKVALGFISGVCGRFLPKLEISGIATGEKSPFVNVAGNKQLCTPWLFSCPRKMCPQFKNRTILFEKIEFGMRYSYVSIDLFPEIYEHVKFVRTVSPLKGKLNYLELPNRLNR